jgi:hypothetical protein
MKLPPPVKERKLEKKSLSLTTATWERLEEISAEQKMEMLAFARFVIESYIEEYDDMVKRGSKK